MLVCVLFQQIHCEVSTIMNNLGEDMTNWECLVDDLTQDGLSVAAWPMNPHRSGGLQTRERLYQIWYQHEVMKARGEAAVDDSQVAAQVQLATSMMDHLNTHMDLGLEMRHVLLPSSHQAVVAAEAQIANDMQAKAKRLDKIVWKKEEKHNNEDDDDDDEADKKVGGVPKWHKHHKAVWEYLFDEGSDHGEWSPEAVEEHVPERYAANVWYLSMCNRNKDILRMLDLKTPPELLVGEVVVDLRALPVNE